MIVSSHVPRKQSAVSVLNPDPQFQLLYFDIFISSLHILNMNTLQDMVFSHSVGFVFNVVSFPTQSILVGCDSICQLFLLRVKLLDFYSGSYCPLLNPEVTSCSHL